MTPAAHPLMVEIELPRWGVVKRRADGAIDFVSPVPCPFNYGSVPGTRADDGDPRDALVLGARLARGQRVSVEVIGAIHFVDAGDDDTKLVCAPVGTRPAGRAGALLFLHAYAIAKRVLNAARGKRGRTACLGWRDPGELG